jgi:SAM-dependent methyltransferase
MKPSGSSAHKNSTCSQSFDALYQNEIFTSHFLMTGFIQNVRKPQGLGGSIMLSIMTFGHKGLSQWGRNQVSISPTDHILDVGCGSGYNIEKMLQAATTGRVCGLDYSELCVSQSIARNRSAVTAGRSVIKLGSVTQIPWPANSFDLVTSFECVYFWPSLLDGLCDIHRVLKPGGKVLLVNEISRDNDSLMGRLKNWWMDYLDMKVYSGEELKAALSKAGFANAEYLRPAKAPHNCAKGVKQ